MAQTQTEKESVDASVINIDNKIIADSKEDDEKIEISPLAVPLVGFHDFSALAVFQYVVYDNTSLMIQQQPSSAPIPSQSVAHSSHSSHSSSPTQTQPTTEPDDASVAVLNINNNKIVPDSKEDEETNVVSVDESLQKKSDISPLAPLVTFHFVGIRPTKLHEKNKQTSTGLLGISSTEITFKNLTLNDSVNKLKELIAEQFEVPKERSLLIMYGNTKLVKNDELLTNYGITDHSYFLVALYDNIGTNHKDVYVPKNDEEDEMSRRCREDIRRQRDMDSVKRRLKRIQDLKNGIKVEPSNNKKKKDKMI
eukprot:162824_1